MMLTIGKEGSITVGSIQVKNNNHYRNNVHRGGRKTFVGLLLFVALLNVSKGLEQVKSQPNPEISARKSNSKITRSEHVGGTNVVRPEDIAIVSILDKPSVPVGIIENRNNADRMEKEKENGSRMLQVTSFVDVFKIPPVQDDLMAVIHIGPMKTGSSAIQKAISVVRKPFQLEDRYEIAGKAILETTRRRSETWHFIGCYTKDDNDQIHYVPPNPKNLTAAERGFELLCDNSTIDIVKNISVERRHHVLLSAEYLPNKEIDTEMLSKFFKTYWNKQRIVAYYRRYYEWLISFHNQGAKARLPPDRVNVDTFLTKEYESQWWYRFAYITKAVENYRKYYDDIYIVNIYDLPNRDGRKEFYCNAIPNAPAACAKYKAYELEQEEKEKQIKKDSSRRFVQRRRRLSDDDRENHSEPLVYSDLAYYAQKMNLWDSQNGNETLIKIVSAMARKKHSESKKEENEAELGEDNRNGSYEFTKEYIRCPSKEVMQWLLERSLGIEKELLPQFYKEKGEKQLRDEFQRTKYKMCSIDAEAVLQHHTLWREFFQSIQL